MNADELIADVQNAPDRHTAQQAAVEALPSTDELSTEIKDCSNRIEELAQNEQAPDVAMLMKKVERNLKALDNDEEPPMEPDELVQELNEGLSAHRDEKDELDTIRGDLQDSTNRLQSALNLIDTAIEAFDADNEIEGVVIEQLENERGIFSNLQDSISKMLNALETFIDNKAELTTVIETQRDRLKALTDALT